MIETRTPDRIHQEISGMLSNGVSYIDALVEYARVHNLEIETVASIIKKSSIMKEKVREEASDMRLIKRANTNDDITKLCK